MKTMKAVFLSLILMAMLPARAWPQLAVLDATLNTFLAGTWVEQAAYYTQSVFQLVENVKNTYNQFQNMLRAEQMALNNLKSISDVRSFNDFMRWQNRQLSMEQEAQYRLANMGVQIGDKKYGMAEIRDIPNAMKTNYGAESWNKDFTEDQRREMWISAGLSPGNYTYIEYWQDREKKITDKLLAMPDIIDADNAAAAAANVSIAEKYAGNADLPENEQVTGNEILMGQHLTAMDTNGILREIWKSMLMIKDEEISRSQVPPREPPRFSDTYDFDPFARSSEE